MKAVAKVPAAQTWFVCTGYAVVLFAIYDNIANQMPVGYRSEIMPFVSGGIAFLVIPFFQRIWNLCQQVDFLRAQTLSKKRSAEDRLDELERLKRRDMVTPEEYAAKRQEILKDL